MLIFNYTNVPFRRHHLVARFFFSGVLQEVVDFDLVVRMEHFQLLKDAYAMVSYRLKHSKEILSPLSSPISMVLMNTSTALSLHLYSMNGIRYQASPQSKKHQVWLAFVPKTEYRLIHEITTQSPLVCTPSRELWMAIPLRQGLLLRKIIYR
jgi:hypothetical protein